MEEADERLLPAKSKLGKAFKAAQRSLDNVFAVTDERLKLHQLAATAVSKLQLEYPKNRDAAAINAAPRCLPDPHDHKEGCERKGEVRAGVQSARRRAGQAPRERSPCPDQYRRRQSGAETARGAGGSLGTASAPIRPR